MSESTPLIIITGPPGAGKSTASEGVAANFNPAAVVAGDAFFDFLRQGRIAPWEAEAHEQNTTVVRATMLAASAYAIGGITPVVDGILGPWFMDEIHLSVPAEIEIHYVILSAELETVRERAGSGGETPEQSELRANVAAQMHQSFAEATNYASHVIDTTSITPQDGVAAVIAGLNDGRFRLAR